MGIFQKLFGVAQAAKTPSQPIGPKAVPSPESIEARYQRMVSALKANARPAFIPVTEERSSTFDAANKMGGYPYLRHTDDWPRCTHCKKHMQLFVQLDMTTLPMNASTGLVQLFYCTNGDDECDIQANAWEPFSDGAMARRIIVDGPSASTESDITDLYPERVITGWNKVEDHPTWEEMDELEPGFRWDEEVYEMMDKRGEGKNHSGDKLFGWPYWVQGVEYPADRKTGSRMQLLFQIDSEVNLPFMFGDSGVGHLTVSPDDPNELAFGWACY